jgi:hypothetical protein
MFSRFNIYYFIYPVTSPHPLHTRRYTPATPATPAHIPVTSSSSGTVATDAIELLNSLHQNLAPDFEQDVDEVRRMYIGTCMGHMEHALEAATATTAAAGPPSFSPPPSDVEPMVEREPNTFIYSHVSLCNILIYVVMNGIMNADLGDPMILCMTMN